MDNFEKLRKAYLNEEYSEETRRDNEDWINEKQAELTANTSIMEWRAHEVTSMIQQDLIEGLKENYEILATNRKLDKHQRNSYFSKIDAIKYILDLMGSDSEKKANDILSEIESKLSAI